MEWLLSYFFFISAMPRWVIGSALGSGFFLYYFLEVAKVRNYFILINFSQVILLSPRLRSSYAL